MKKIKRYLYLLKYLVKNEFNHEFNPIMEEVEYKLNLKLPNTVLFGVVLIYQYAFIFLLLLALNQFKDSTLFLIIFSLTAIFNLILPSTIARMTASKIIENPAYECLKMSRLSSSESTRLSIFAELINFWIHNFLIEFIVLWLFYLKFKALGLLFGLLWIGLVSFIFLRTLISQLKPYNNNSQSLLSYLVGLVFSGYISYKIFEIFIGSLHTLPLDEILMPGQLSIYLQRYMTKVLAILNQQLLTLLSSVLFFVLLIIAINVFSRKYFSTANKFTPVFFKKYIAVLVGHSKNYWVKRDVKRIFNIIDKLSITPFTIIFPSGIVFLVVAMSYYVFKGESLDKIIIISSFLLWVSVYQFANLLVQRIPIFNISSELQNIDLLTMADKSIQKLIQSKQILLAIFCSPLLLTMWLEKIILIFLGANFYGIALSMLTDVGIYILCILLVLKWTTVFPNFKWDNIFLIRQDNYDQQILQQFLLVPSRMITIYFSVSFTLVQIIKIDFKLDYLLLYFLLNIVVILIFMLLIKRRRKDELTIR